MLSFERTKTLQQRFRHIGEGEVNKQVEMS